MGRLGEARYTISMTIDIDDTDMVCKAFQHLEDITEERIEDGSFREYVETNPYLDPTDQDREHFLYNQKLLNEGEEV